MNTPAWKMKAISRTTPLANKKRKEVVIKKPLRENIVFVGSEMSYDLFWLKMMFISAAYRVAKDGELFRTADKTTLAYVDNGYVRPEKLTLDYLSSKHGCTIKKITRQADITTLLNENRDNCKLQDVAFFSHGVIGSISLNYSGGLAMDFNAAVMGQIRKDAFVNGGKIYSYACRTGISVNNYFAFNNDAEAKPENSLAQQMADHFNIEVHAFLRRTQYGSVLREKSQSASIASTLKEKRKANQNDSLIVNISSEHEALPHPGLANEGMDNWIRTSGPKGEGTDNYSLWRKMGGRALPVAADTPKGLSSHMRKYVPKAWAKAKKLTAQ